MTPKTKSFIVRALPWAAGAVIQLAAILWTDPATAGLTFSLLIIAAGALSLIMIRFPHLDPLEKRKHERGGVYWMLTSLMQGLGLIGLGTLFLLIGFSASYVFLLGHAGFFSTFAIILLAGSVLGHQLEWDRFEEAEPKQFKIALFWSTPGAVFIWGIVLFTVILQ